MSPHRCASGDRFAKLFMSEPALHCRSLGGLAPFLRLFLPGLFTGCTVRVFAASRA